MTLAIEVPLNTMLADLDESLRRLLRGEFERHGFGGVNIAFDAPGRDWAAKLSGPTLNLFMYDLREATQQKHGDWGERRGNGAARLVRPPLQLDCSYAVTAWTQAVEDEHRLLSQALAVLLAHERLPAESLAGDLAGPETERSVVKTRIGAARGEGKADFWTAVGGAYKVSVDYAVTLSCDTGVVHHRGPEVRSQTLRIGQLDTGPRTLEELHRLGGTVLDAQDRPVADAWLALPDAGGWAVTDQQGRFRFGRGVRTGSHRCLVRGADGKGVEIELTAPGADSVIRLGSRRRS